MQSISSLITLAILVVGLVQCAPTEELKGSVYKIDQEIQAIERANSPLVKKIYWNQLEIANKIALKNPKSSLAVRSIAYRLTKAEETRRYISNAAMEAIKDLLMSLKDTPMDGKTKLGSTLFFDVSMVNALIERAKLRAAIDGFVYTNDDWRYLSVYISHYGKDKEAASSEFKSLVRDLYEQLKVNRESVETIHQRQVAAVSDYLKQHAEVQESTVVHEMDKLIDEWMGCPSCSQFRGDASDDEDDETYGAYPMFSDPQQLEESVAKKTERKLRISMAEVQRNIEGKVYNPSEDELEDVDLGDIDELVNKIVGV